MPHSNGPAPWDQKKWTDKTDKPYDWKQVEAWDGTTWREQAWKKKPDVVEQEEEAGGTPEETGEQKWKSKADGGEQEEEAEPPEGTAAYILRYMNKSTKPENGKGSVVTGELKDFVSKVLKLI